MQISAKYDISHKVNALGSAQAGGHPGCGHASAPARDSRRGQHCRSPGEPALAHRDYAGSIKIAQQSGVPVVLDAGGMEGPISEELLKCITGCPPIP
eukprot:scaffold218125_cov42-Prasinocladus_malaysianus.AAC.1